MVVSVCCKVNEDEILDLLLVLNLIEGTNHQ